MGLLDDAIREHLELKRQHGADPSEVAKQEAEVLGAPRTPTAPREDAPSEPAEPAAARPEVDDRAEPAAPPAPAAPPEPVDDPSEPGRDPEPDALREPPAAGPPTQRFTPDDDLDWSDPAPAPSDEPDVVPADEEESEDVLEETPEFLQETPEHDRLWFEQRPPRDFDF